MSNELRTKFLEQPFEGDYEYVCFDEPPWSREQDDDEDDDEETEDPDKKKMFELPAAEYPTHKWVMMRETLKLLSDNCREAMQRDPDSFGMYVYNEFFNYAVIDLLENLCKQLNTALNKNDFHQAWAVVATIAQFLDHGAHGGIWMHADDGDRVQALSEVIGRGILASLNALDRINELKADSKFRDLGMVMALFVAYSGAASDLGVESGLDDDEETGWPMIIVSYALKAGIDLTDKGVAGIEDLLEDMEVEAFEGEPTATKWNYTKTLNQYLRTHGRMNTPVKGGPTFNIMQWTRAKRAEYAFDNEDPLKDIPEDVIKEGKLVLS